MIYPKPIRDLNEEIVAPSRRLALDLRTALRSADVPTANYIGRRGLSQRGDLGGLNLSKVPKVFVEMGNMRNAHDARVMSRPHGRGRYAEGLLHGIRRYLGR